MTACRTPRKVGYVCFWIVIILMMTLLPARTSLAQEAILVKADGVGSIQKGDVGRARDTAIQDALRKAVEQAVGTFINAETMVQNYTVINSSIYAQSEGYVKDYVVLVESSDEKLFRVTVEAHVATDRLQDDLAAIGLLMERKHKPRVMVVIPEFHISRPIPDPAGETEIIRRLLESGFKVVDQSQVAKIRYNDRVRASIKGDASLAARIGLDHGAEIIVVGEAFSETAGRVSQGFISCRARVEARAIRTDTGEILVADGKHAAGLDLSEAVAGKKALQKAGSDISTYFIERILARWSGEVTNLSSVELVITGVDYKQFIRFKKALKDSVRGISAIHHRSFTDGRGVVEVDLKGNAQSLSEELVLTDFDDFMVDVTDFSANRLTILVGKKTK